MASDAESIRSELEQLRANDAIEREASREQLISLQEGLAALTATLDQRQEAKRDQSEKRLVELRELQGELQATRTKGGPRGRRATSAQRQARQQRRRPASAGPAPGGRSRWRSCGRPHLPESSRVLSRSVAGRKGARTVSTSTGAVRELGRNSLEVDERAVLKGSRETLRRSSASLLNRERPWREGGDLTTKPSAAEIVSAYEVSDERQHSFNRKLEAESKRYRDVISRSEMEWSRQVSKPGKDSDYKDFEKMLTASAHAIPTTP